MKKPKELGMIMLDFIVDENEPVFLANEENFNILLEGHNNLVEVVNKLIEIGKVSNPIYENMFEED